MSKASGSSGAPGTLALWAVCQTEHSGTERTLAMTRSYFSPGGTRHAIRVSWPSSP